MQNISVNFRDVEEFTNLLAGKVLMKEQHLFRRGKITEVESLHQIGSPKTIINLRRGKDAYFSAVKDNRLEVYDTSNSKVQRWLNEMMMCLQCSQIPVLVHCTSGKDRTGGSHCSITRAARYSPRNHY